MIISGIGAAFAAEQLSFSYGNPSARQEIAAKRIRRCCNRVASRASLQWTHFDHGAASAAHVAVAGITRGGSNEHRFGSQAPRSRSGFRTQSLARSRHRCVPKATPSPRACDPNDVRYSRHALWPATGTWAAAGCSMIEVSTVMKPSTPRALQHLTNTFAAISCSLPMDYRKEKESCSAANAARSR